MLRRPPRSTRTDTLFPYTTPFRSLVLEARAVFDGDHAFLANLVHRVGDDRADRFISVGRHGADLRDRLAILARHGVLLDFLGDGFDGLVDAALDVHRVDAGGDRLQARSEEHTSELQSLMRISYAVFGLK